ncbi:unnamed protein product [Ambrosiozyma monospora]|uniref:Unnamed protein product n=1 Tax=Ambrosiozyma monospora TaxID=43982 RepID=A0A9W6YWK1_AMBMO|nr:unnamed protein product [Ambrosiozyma monospora]
MSAPSESTSLSVPAPAPAEIDEITLDYPVVSILYCVKCKWMLRANWYQQELLQTFASKQDQILYPNANKLTLNSVILKPSLVAGTFKIYLKKSKDEDWILLWDRKQDGGFPDSKIIKQKIRDVIHPQLKMNHLDKKNKNDGKLITGSSVQSKGSVEQHCVDCKTWEY